MSRHMELGCWEQKAPSELSNAPSAVKQHFSPLHPLLPKSWFIFMHIIRVSVVTKWLHILFPHLPWELPPEWTKYSDNKKKYCCRYVKEVYKYFWVNHGWNSLNPNQLLFFCLFVCLHCKSQNEEGVTGSKEVSVCPLMPAVVLWALDLCFFPSSLIKLNDNVWFLKCYFNGVGCSRWIKNIAQLLQGSAFPGHGSSAALCYSVICS